MNTGELQAKHRKHVLTPWLAQGGLSAPVIVRGEGRYLFDSDGTRYLDLGSGLIAVNLGHGHPKVVAAIREQAGTLAYAAPGLFHDKRAELAAELSEISPWGNGEGCRTFFTTTGAESNDDAVRLARAITGRTKILTAFRSFHGSTGTSIMLTGEDRRWGGEPGPPGIMRFFAPYPYRSPFYSGTPEEETKRAIDNLERVLMHEDPKRVAAILIEPVVGSNGVIVYPNDYLPALRELTQKHGILLVCDEVMTGFGRTGAAFGAQRFDIVPDMITFAKGVTSGTVPMGGVIASREIHDAFMVGPPGAIELFHGYTYSAHVLACAAGVATLQLYEDEGLFERGRKMAPVLEEAVHSLKGAPHVIDIRNYGLAAAIELEPRAGAPGARTFDTYLGCWDEGVLVRQAGEIVCLAPALIVEESHIARITDTIRAVLGRVK